MIEYIAPFNTSAYQNYLEVMKTSSLPERQELCKDLEYLCSKDATILEEVIDEYVYLLKDKRIEEMKEYVKKEMHTDL